MRRDIVWEMKGERRTRGKGWASRRKKRFRFCEFLVLHDFPYRPKKPERNGLPFFPFPTRLRSQDQSSEARHGRDSEKAEESKPAPKARTKTSITETGGRSKKEEEERKQSLSFSRSRYLSGRAPLSPPPLSCSFIRHHRHIISAASRGARVMFGERVRVLCVLRGHFLFWRGGRGARRRKAAKEGERRNGLTSSSLDFFA